MSRTDAHPFGTILKGFCVGTADIVPGVSGGTVALALGVYERLLQVIRALDLSALRMLYRLDFSSLCRHAELPFALLFGMGGLAALVFFTRVVSLPGLMQTHPVEIYGLFFGLVTASIVVLFLDAGKAQAHSILSLLCGLIVGFLILDMRPTETPESMWFIFCSGFLAITATLLPGISGSFVLLLLKKYAYIMQALASLQIAVLIPFALGALVGLLSLSRVLLYLLHHHWQRTVYCMLGLLLSSLWWLWPFRHQGIGSSPAAPSLRPDDQQPTLGDETTWTVWCLILCGFAAVCIMQRLAANRRGH